jgi:predicted acyl esterase
VVEGDDTFSLQLGTGARARKRRLCPRASRQKWLELHGVEHWTHFYTDYGRLLQKRFFDFFLKGIDNGWAEEPRVRLQIRHIDRFVERMEHEWPIGRTTWTKLYLNPADRSLSWGRRQGASVRPNGRRRPFFTTIGAETEITGPSAVKLFVSSSTTDADIFVVLRVFSPDGKEIVFQGAIDPHCPISQGWLRASHRKLDPDLSTTYRPYHTHDEKAVATRRGSRFDVEIWPTSIVVPAGYRIGLTVRGKDYEYQGASGGRIASFKNELKGCGPFLHDDPRDRPPEIFEGKTTLHVGADRASYLVLPIFRHESDRSTNKPDFEYEIRNNSKGIKLRKLRNVFHGIFRYWPSLFLFRVSFHSTQRIRFWCRPAVEMNTTRRGTCIIPS